MSSPRDRVTTRSTSTSSSTMENLPPTLVEAPACSCRVTFSPATWAWMVWHGARRGGREASVLACQEGQEAGHLHHLGLLVLGHAGGVVRPQLHHPAQAPLLQVLQGAGSRGQGRAEREGSKEKGV